MNILVLGGNGFIGSHLVDRLLREGHSICVYDRHKEYYRKPLKNVEYCFGEFGNRGLLADAVASTDIVFHLISTSLPKSSNEDPIFDVQSNILESLFLMEQCVSSGVKKIIFISSGGTIYGEGNTLPIKEESSKNPLCSYGITKLMIEKYLFLFNHLYGLKSTIIRPSNPYGPRQNFISMQGVISVFLNKIFNKESIEIWGDGKITRDYIYIDDLIDGIYRAFLCKENYSIFNLGSGIGYSINDVLRAIRKVVNHDVKVYYKNQRPCDVHKIYLDIDSAKNKLQWNPTTSLEDGIRATWDFICNSNNTGISNVHQ